jgi:hypothetical protein
MAARRVIPLLILSAVLPLLGAVRSGSGLSLLPEARAGGDEWRIAAFRESLQRQALAYRAGQLPRPALYAKGILSEKNAATKEPNFNHGYAPAKDAATVALEIAARRAKALALAPGYHPAVQVAAPGRLDWTFVVSDESLDPAAFAASAGYVSTRQSYEFYSPPPAGPARPLPLIVWISTGPRSTGWAYFKQTCEKHRVLFAGVHGAGNDATMAWRARTVLDVLDDVRRRFPVDPDRTYLVGVSGAGHAADSIAHALPELFGGVMAICGAWNLRLEPATRLRVAERLSEAVVTGGGDFNGPELQREFFPILRHENIRSQLWVYPAMGHGCPGPAQLEQVFQWLEAGLPQRRLAGAVFPASRLWGTPTAAEWSAALIHEAGRRLSMPGGEESGLFLLQGVAKRWKSLPAGQTAQALLNEFDKVSQVPWNDIYRAEQLRFRYLQAKTFDGIVDSPLPANYPVPRSNLQLIAVSLWQDIQQLAAPRSPVAQEAAIRLATLQKQLGG